MNTLYSCLKPLLFGLDPEKSHYLTLKTLKVLQRLHLLPHKKLSAPIQAMGLHFPNFIGLSAGLDKNGDYFDALGHLGFGFIEIGTITPRPQPGNTKPRLFRYPKNKAIINRMGFNNAGIDYLLKQVEQKRKKYSGILGISISQNTHTPYENAIDEYLFSFQKVYPYADYIAVNISCPNVNPARNLQFGPSFEHLLETLKTEQQTLHQQWHRYVPLVIKLSPDLPPSQWPLIADALLKYQIDGAIVCNTTQKRPVSLIDEKLESNGGLSGKPLLETSLALVKQLKNLCSDKLVIIASGGIQSGQDAQMLMEAGATLVQIYTGLIYRGPKLIEEIVQNHKQHNPC